MCIQYAGEPGRISDPMFMLQPDQSAQPDCSPLFKGSNVQLINSFNFPPNTGLRIASPQIVNTGVVSSDVFSPSFAACTAGNPYCSCDQVLCVVIGSRPHNIILMLQILGKG